MKRKILCVLLVLACLCPLLVPVIMFNTGKYYDAQKLIDAIEAEDVQQVEFLLESGVDPNQTDIPPSNYWSFFEFSARRPMAHACRTGNLEIVRLLIKHGATAEYIEYTGWSPLRETLFYYHPDDVEIVNILLENGSKIDDKHDEEDIALVAARMTPKVFDKEMQNGTVFAGGYDEATAKGITEIVVTLLGDRPLNDITYAGKTLLITAVQQENVYLANYLISAGADVSLKDNAGKTAYDYALESQNNDLISLFTT